jgi:hypothetical protein
MEDRVAAARLAMKRLPEADAERVSLPAFAFAARDL